MKDANLKVVRTEFKQVKRPHESGDGYRANSYYKIMKELTKIMRESGRSYNEIADFQKDFLKNNGVNVPDSFIVGGDESAVTTYFKSFDKNIQISLKNLYDDYVEWCHNSGYNAIAKGEFSENIRIGAYKDVYFRKTATLNGVTRRNVVEIRKVYDFMTVFLTKYCIVGKGKTTRKEIYEHYDNLREQLNFPFLTKRQLYKLLRQKGIGECRCDGYDYFVMTRKT